VSLRIRHARELADIEVADTGPGLSAAEIARVFEPFARGEGAGRAAPGAGLGLTIAKMLTDLMGGELTVHSEPGAGATFRVRLFVPQVHGARAGAQEPVRPQGYAGVRRRILVVDNEEADRELLVQLLEPLGFELRTAASGHDALDLLAAGLDPDVMLMDLAMPGIDGWETLRRARRLVPLRARVAIVSANAFDKGLDNDAGIRPEDFLLKPVRHSELLDWLQRALDLRWLAAPPNAALSAAAPAPVAQLARPDAATLQSLAQLAHLGYPRGVLNKLDEIEAAQPEAAPFCAAMRELARAFQFDAMARQLAALAAAPAAEVTR
jgi:CheY-like chemotaxis protein